MIQPTLKNPAPWNGKRIGLLGGSFNPAHDGHLHIGKIALEQFDLDEIWWLVTPQNPLKDTKDTASYEERFASVEKTIEGEPNMVATHLEAELGSQYTYETVTKLKAAFPGTEFIFICGMDNAVIFHKWDRWQDLIREIPIVFIARPEMDIPAQDSPLRLFKDAPHHEETKGGETDLKKPGVYWLRRTPEMDISSTEIRNKNNRIK